LIIDLLNRENDFAVLTFRLHVDARDLDLVAFEGATERM